MRTNIEDHHMELEVGAFAVYRAITFKSTLPAHQTHWCERVCMCALSAIWIVLCK